MGSFDTGLDMEHPPDAEARKAYLQKAIEAAKAHDIRTALEALYLGHILDGLFRRLKGKWKKLSEDDIYDALAQAIVQLLEKVITGEQVLRPIPYLIKVADGNAFNKWKINDHISEVEIDTLPEKDEKAELSSTDSDAMRGRALSIARGFLPQLGQENVRLVMEYLFDAIEKRVEDISNQEIGDALGLSQVVIRQSKTRGWQRLERIAKDNGYHIDVSFLKGDSEENEGEENE